MALFRSLDGNLYEIPDDQLATFQVNSPLPQHAYLAGEEVAPEPTDASPSSCASNYIWNAPTHSAPPGSDYLWNGSASHEYIWNAPTHSAPPGSDYLWNAPASSEYLWDAPTAASSEYIW